MKPGGEVLDTVDCGDRVWINTKAPESGHEQAIYVERTPESRSVSPGDTIWWYASRAFWTPHKAPFRNMILKKRKPAGAAP